MASQPQCRPVSNSAHDTRRRWTQVLASFLLLLATVPAVLPQQHMLPDGPLFRIVWPRESGRMPAGWIEVLYSVHPQHRCIQAGFLIAVLIDGEPIDAQEGDELQDATVRTRRSWARWYPSVALGKIPVWIGDEGVHTLTLLQQEEETAGQEPECGGLRQHLDECKGSYTRVSKSKHGDFSMLNLEVPTMDGGEEMLAEEWALGSASVSLLVEKPIHSEMGVHLVTPFPGQVVPPDLLAVAYQVYAMPEAITNVSMHIDGQEAQRYSIDCRDMSACDHVHDQSIHILGLMPGAHVVEISLAGSLAGAGDEQNGMGDQVAVSAWFSVLASVDETLWQFSQLPPSALASPLVRAHNRSRAPVPPPHSASLTIPLEGVFEGVEKKVFGEGVAAGGWGSVSGGGELWQMERGEERGKCWWGGGGFIRVAYPPNGWETSELVKVEVEVLGFHLVLESGVPSNVEVQVSVGGVRAVPQSVKGCEFAGAAAAEWNKFCGVCQVVSFGLSLPPPPPKHEKAQELVLLATIRDKWKRDMVPATYVHVSYGEKHATNRSCSALRDGNLGSGVGATGGGRSVDTSTCASSSPSSNARSHARTGHVPVETQGQVGATGPTRRVALVLYEWPPMPDMNGDAERCRQLSGVLERLDYRVVVVVRECLGMWGSPLDNLPPSLLPDYVCGPSADNARRLLLAQPHPPTVAFAVSTYWYHPQRQSLVDLWAPALRALAPSCRIIIMVDVLLCRRHITPPPRPRDGFATIEDPKLIEGGQRSGPEAETETGSGSEEEEGMWRRRVEEEEEGLEASVWVSEGRAHAALQLFSLTAADAVGTELPEDTDFLAPLLPHVPVRPLRYIRGSHYDYAPLCNAGEGPLPASTGSTAEFVGRRGMLFMGSAHSINVESVVFLMDEILPRLLARGVAAEDLVLHVIGPNMNHQQHILEHRMQRHLRLYGRVRGPEQEALMQGVKVFVSPAVSGPASFKTKNLEALARGLPVVTTRLGSLGLHRPAAKGHTLSGVAVAPADPDLLADRVAQLLLNSTVWKTAAAAACAFADAHFHPRNLEAEARELLAAAGL